MQFNRTWSKQYMYNIMCFIHKFVKDFMTCFGKRHSHTDMGKNRIAPVRPEEIQIEKDD